MLLTGLGLLRIGNHSKFVNIDERCNGVLKDNSQGLINLRKDIANKITEKDEYFQESKALGIDTDKRIGEMDAYDPDSVYGRKKSADGLGIEEDVGEKPSCRKKRFSWSKKYFWQR